MKVSLRFKYKGIIKDHPIPLSNSCIVGRSGSCDFQTEDEKVSGRHSRFFLKYDRLEIIDLDSKNGTYLNGIRIENSEMFMGDEVRVGETIITLEESNVDSEALDALTFPGPAKDRMSYELKADFTGARIQNQHPDQKGNIQASVSHAREIDLRKKIKSKLKLSKQEIRVRNKKASQLATILDVAAMLSVLSIPLFITSQMANTDQDQQFNLLVAMEGVAIAIFYFVNFKKSKFSVGEKLSGLEKLYKKQ
jgi:hypothetical protein